MRTIIDDAFHIVQHAGITRIVRESDYSPAAVHCMQKKARVSQDIEWLCNSDINQGP